MSTGDTSKAGGTHQNTGPSVWQIMAVVAALIACFAVFIGTCGMVFGALLTNPLLAGLGAAATFSALYLLARMLPLWPEDGRRMLARTVMAAALAVLIAAIMLSSWVTGLLGLTLVGLTQFIRHATPSESIDKTHTGRMNA